MRTFAQKPKTTQPAKYAKAPTVIRTHVGQGRDPNSIFNLQRTMGNQALLRLLQSNAEERNALLTGTTSPHFGHDFGRISVTAPKAGAIQTKLATNKPGDEYEQDADRIAQQVMRMPEPQVQGACPCGGGCPKCQTESRAHSRQSLQTKRVESGVLGLAEVPPSVLDVLHSPGRPLDPATRAFMEPRFGHDFSKVRVHTDALAAKSAQAINALAYTIGDNITFGSGHYSPEMNRGKALLAHELTHVVQQGAGKQSRKLMVQRQARTLSEIDRKALPPEVQLHLDKPRVFHGKQPLTVTIRVDGIDIHYPDGGEVYVDRSQTPLDPARTMHKLEEIEARLPWYIRILGPSTASGSRTDALLRSELANRLFIIRRMTEGKTLPETLAELTYLEEANFRFIAVSAQVAAFISGMGLGAAGKPPAASAASRGIMGRAAALRQMAEKELALAKKRGGEVAVNIGGKGEIKGAINVNPNISSVERAPVWPNAVPAKGEAIGDLFPVRSLDAVYGRKLPSDLNWAKIAEGAFRTLKPGGKVEIGVFGSAEALAAELRRLGFRNVKVISKVIVEAVKP